MFNVSVGTIIPASVEKKGLFTQFEIHVNTEYECTTGPKFYIKGPLPNHKGREVCVLSVTDDNGNQLVVGVKVKSRRKIQAEYQIETIKVNVDNERLSDADFRQFIRQSLT